MPCSWPTGGSVHRGLKTLPLAFWKTIDGVLDEIELPLFYTGHSMGGAPATMAATLRPPQGVYTFGAPRIGDREFCSALVDTPVFNIISPNDIVTSLPPSGGHIQFRRAGTNVKTIEGASAPNAFVQAPIFLASHAPMNYTAQLPLAFETSASTNGSDLSNDQ